MPTQLRLSITLSGGASLGAYEAGATAALVVAAQHLVEAGDDRLRVEAMGGASAGALVAFFAAHALADGIDPVALLRTAWVERVSLNLLRSRHGLAPLHFDDMRRGLFRVLGAGDDPARHPPTRTPHPTPIALHVSLTGLRGLTYPIRAMRRDQDITGVTYADWARFTIQPGSGPRPLMEPEGRSPLDYVLASTANPGGFAPRLLDRSDDAAEYRDRGIRDLPDHGRLWYIDGGLIQVEPLGRVVGAGKLLSEESPDGGGPDPDVRRVNLVIDARSEGPSGSQRWGDPERQARWEQGLSRALAILPAQVLYDDLRRTEKRNTRLDWLDALVDRLAEHLDPEAEAALDEVLRDIDRDRAELRSDAPAGEQRERWPGEEPRRRKLRRVVEEIAGLVAKEPVDVDVISPRLVTQRTGEDVPELLAGEFLGDFGGFLREDLRESDFRLGYETARIWMDGALAEAGFDRSTVASLLEQVDAQSPGDWRDANRGSAGLRDLPWRARLRLARYAIHMGRVIAAGVLGRG